MTGFDALTIVAAAAEAAQHGPVERTLALRAALDRLLVSATGDTWPFDQFWREVGNPVENAFSDSEARVYRSAMCHAALRGIMRLVGYRNDIEGWARLMAAVRQPSDNSAS